MKDADRGACFVPENGQIEIEPCTDVFSPPVWPGSSTPMTAWSDRRDISSPVFSDDSPLDLARYSTVIRGAGSMDRATLEQSVRSAYLALLRSLGHRVPWRFWNYIPSLHSEVGPGISRYMAFNAGRYSAISEWLGGPREIERRVATATGVGHTGQDLAIYCLAGLKPGTPVENPRQTPSYRYSARYGPVPPCFARATIVDAPAGRTTLIGGTASVRGEHSTYEGDLAGQIQETLANIAALIRMTCTGDCDPSPGDRAWLGRMRSLRTYCVPSLDPALVDRVISPHFPASARREFVSATICRPELLIEIEGTADATPGEP